MPTPINFSVAAASRVGSFQTSQLTMPAGYSNLAWQLVGMGTGAGSDYENVANSLTVTVQFDPAGGTNYRVYSTSVWTGGPATSRSGVTDPPPNFAVNLANIPVGSSIVIQVSIPRQMTVGIGSGVLS